jgi:DNA topoisomerase VI subunit B
MAAVPALARTTFRTSRLLEFCSQKELTAQTGHEPDDWPLVILKELVDNALDACEEAGITPAIRVTVARGKIRVRDNGPGIPPATVTDIPTSRAASPAARRTSRRTAAPKATRSRRSSPCRSP